jgi:glucosamine 6-phosphate synthetase-like amidotransferase/phosphosugar isomerase protein
MVASLHCLASPLRRDIDRQPDLLAALAARADAFAQTGRRVLQPAAGGRLFVTGCGDGYFAAQSAAAHAERAGLDWRPTHALDMVLAAPRLTAADRVIAISMSGNVDRTVEAAVAVQAAGVPLVALVNSADGGRLGGLAAARLSLDIDDVAPFLCGTASYTATVLALMALATGAAGMRELPQVDTLPAAQRAVLQACDAVLPSVALPSGVRLLSAGVERGTVAYGAAKLVELTRIASWSADLEEFAHSQYWSMPISDLVVVVATDPALAGYADASCAALSELGVATLAVDMPASPVARATHRITLPDVEQTLAPLVTALPMQLLAAQLARRSGLDPDTRAHLKADATRFRVSRMLTRRSLLGTGA